MRDQPKPTEFVSDEEAQAILDGQEWDGLTSDTETPSDEEMDAYYDSMHEAAWLNR